MWLDQYQKGKLVVEVDTRDLSREIHRFGAVGEKLAAAAIIAGSVVAAGIVLAALLFAGEGLGDSSVLPLALAVTFLVLLGAGLWAAWRLSRQEPDERSPSG
jgi:hypothetical protein